ncbi:DUF1801 domain-containing protein [Mucilaginibacter pedocola]|uniref:YdhG-like domain-containing protein n=1 Tax=Mucilaginibacter pedocola TaxID=1792845 RepID=A0A1S9PM40_9SPHI|nr:DUF1801 domain-containing protein [Mucilaginibacter pedocola]OOQ62007.1 hypothetical protein BC343_02835 [Mucilaginibacter pedocola]
MRPIDQYFSNQPEPHKSALAFLRNHILALDSRLTEEWKYSMPMYCLKGKMFCYLWVHKKYKQPYIGIVEGGRLNHPDLLQEKRARMKILLIDAEADIPVEKVDEILRAALEFYK